MVNTCNGCNLMQAVNQKPDNHLEWPYMELFQILPMQAQAVHAGRYIHCDTILVKGMNGFNTFY